jgi:glycerol-3-phosphate dehydrogenase
VARDAALRGLRVALVDRRDLGWGTSSRSSRLIHGGLRYLEQARLGLVFESLRERRRLLRLAPHLVRPQAFVLPVHRGDRVPRWKLEIGLTLYDLLARGGNLPRHRPLGKRGVLEQEPLLRERGLTGGAIYYDAQCDDARLVVAAARAAGRAGAAVATWTAVTALRREGSRITTAVLRDALDDSEAEVRFRAVVNATGPWTDAIRRLEDPAAAPMLRPTKGVHIVFPRERVGHRHAITFTSPIDGRVMFVLPWGEHSYAGTTDTDTDDSPDRVTTTREDVHYLLRSVNALFPHARLGEEDVLATWAALRPLVAASGDAGPSQVSREHRLAEGPGGMLTVAGGKLTTWRAMAEEVVDRVERRLRKQTGHRPVGGARGRNEPLPGGESAAVAEFARRAEGTGLPPSTAQHLAWHYGTETAAILNLIRERPRLATPLHDRHPAIEAEVIHAARREFAMRVEDILARRIHLAWETADLGVSAAPRVAELLGEELEWPASRPALEVEMYRETVSGQFGWDRGTALS